jgi:hypothetical protein
MCRKKKRVINKTRTRNEIIRHTLKEIRKLVRI